VGARRSPSPSGQCSDGFADARRLEEYERVLATAGLPSLTTEEHDQAMLRMIDQIEARLNLLRMTAPDKLTATGVDLDAAPAVLGVARTAVADRSLGYALRVADQARLTRPRALTVRPCPAGR
jgi:arsenite methyltransferase